MHRAYSVRRGIGSVTLVTALLLHAGLNGALAQGPNPTARSAAMASLEMAVGTSRTHSMSSRAPLKRVENPNSHVVRVEKVTGSNNEIMLVAHNLGRSVITFVDHSGRVEQHEFVVTAAPVAAPPVVVPPVASAPLAMAPAAVQPKELVGPSIELRPGQSTTIPSQLFKQDPKVKFSSSDTRVVDVKIPEKQDILLATGINPGSATITITSGNQTETFKVYVSAEADALQKTINKLVPTATVTVSRDGNNAVINGTVPTTNDARIIQQIAAQNNAIANIQIGGVQQVQLEVIVAVVNRSETRKVGFSWANSRSDWFIASVLGSPLTTVNSLATAVGGGTNALAGSPNVNLGVLSAKNGFNGFLDALRTEGLAKILAEPRVTTLSGRPAYIVSGGEAPIVLPGTAGSPPSINYKPFGTVVTFLPIVMGNGKIHLEVRPELSEKSDALSVTFPGGTAPGFTTRKAEAAVMMEDGQTLAIGGLIQNKVNATIKRVPILGDMPFVGVAFSSKEYKEEEEELVILVTPRLVDPVDCTKIPRYLPGRETRSPDDFELFLEGIMEAPRGQRSVVFDRRVYQGAHKSAPNASQIPCGDTSNYWRGGLLSNDGSCAPGQIGGVSAGMGQRGAEPMPYPGFPPSVPAMPTSNSGGAGNVDLLPAMPSGRDPLTPTMPIPPSRELETRPELPPVSPSLPR